MDKNARIYIAGHRGLVGAAILRRLQSEGYANFITATSRELDLREQAVVRDFFAAQRPDYVFLAAAKVGGILANDTYPAEFIYDNLMMEANIIDAAYRNGTQKLLFLGSTCIYPKLAPQPLKEDYLLTGPLEPTNEWYAVAKIAGIKLCQAYQRQYGARFISAMPTNLYGPGDNFDLEKSHVMPALIRKFHEAKLTHAPSVVVWGTGKPLREFLHVDDCARACVFLMEHYEGADIVNIGTGSDLPIGELAALVKKAVGYTGDIVFDTSKPDGTPRKLVDVGRIMALGWKPEIDLEEGIRNVYEWFLAHVNMVESQVRGMC
ncbi:MAG: GDP-L-fucose synthase [Gammaproteobacteria bacterium]|nr:GDP-L-fucose synthase [Gammaproteobacteria bacterium]